MRRGILILLAAAVMLAAGCQKAEETSAPEGAESRQTEEPEEEPTEEPVELETPGEAEPHPGLPVYVESEEYRAQLEAWEAEAEDGADDGAPDDTPEYRMTVFDHYGDPPAQGTVRVVHIFNYGETKAVLLEDGARVDKVLEIVGGLAASDYGQGALMGGEALEIQVVRDGVHENYSIYNYDYEGKLLAANNREATAWYTADAGSWDLLLGYVYGVE